jgi:hypothetical protein
MHKHFAATGLAKRRLIDVKPSMVQAWVSDRAQVLAPSTLARLVTDLSAVFNSAAHDELIRQSPVRKRLTLPERDDEAIVPLTVEQVRALADAMPDRYRAMVLGTGRTVGCGPAKCSACASPTWTSCTARCGSRTAHPVLAAHQRVDLKTRKSKRTVPMIPMGGRRAGAAHARPMCGVRTCSPRAAWHG